MSELPTEANQIEYPIWFALHRSTTAAASVTQTQGLRCHFDGREWKDIRRQEDIILLEWEWMAIIINNENNNEKQEQQ